MTQLPTCPQCGQPAKRRSSTGRRHLYCGTPLCPVLAFYAPEPTACAEDWELVLGSLKSNV